MSNLFNRTFWVVFLSVAMSSWTCLAERSLRARNLTISQGQTNCLSVLLEADGNENALSFSLCFDTNLLTFTAARRGSDATGASWSVNTNQASSGRLGFVVLLPFGQVFAPGSNAVVEVCFGAAPTTSTVTTQVRMCDAPIGREILDADSGTLATTYADAIVTVLGSCTYALGTNQRAFDASGGSGIVDVSAGTQCAWAVVNQNSWITITSPTSGVGTGSVSYTVVPNPLPNPRTGVLSIAGEPFTVMQSGAQCTVALDPTNRVHTYLSEAALVSMTTQSGCDWSVVNTNDWILIKSATNGTGSETVRYTVLANPNPSGRSAVFTIGGQPFLVSQEAAPCSYSLLPTDRLVGPESASGTVTVFTVPDCTWTVSNTNRWITITSATNGAGYGTVSYTVAASLSPSDRTATVKVADQPFTITQLASPCAYTLSPTNRALAYGSATGTVSVTASTGCTSFAWSVINPNEWISIFSISNGVAHGSVRYTVSANPRTIPRTGEVSIAEQPFRISQAGAPCTYALSPTNGVHSFQSETGLVSVATLGECGWTVRTTNTWITIASATNGLGSGTVSYRVAENPGSPRTGTVLIGGATLTVRQGEAQAPIITNQPVSQNVVGGATVVFTVGATGAPAPNYQWQFNGTNLVDGVSISGAATARLTLFNVQPAQSGNYRVVVSNLRGSMTSAPPAVLRVNTAPVLAPIPDKVINRGTLLTFTASATDADIPRQTLTYSLDTGAPPAANVNPASGVFTWTPSATADASTNRVTLRVTDNGLPPLSAAQIVTITVVPGFTTNVTLVATGSVWRYRDTGEDMGSAWTGLTFNDSAWASGRAKLGYGSGDETTVVSYGPDSSAKYITTYFRSHFAVSDPGTLSALSLRVLRDDGVVVYLNGREAYRDNMPAGPISYLTPAAASASDGGTVYQVSPPVDPGYLVAGDNVVAAEIHQRSGSSSDIAFEVELTGNQSIVAPVVMTQPQSQSVGTGGSVAFRVDALGAPPLHYQWHFNDLPVPDATNATLTLSHLQLVQAGGYFVVVTNFYGATTSAVATLLITNTPPVLAAIGNKLVTEGSLLTFTATASGSGLAAQRLTFSLDPGAPSGASILPTTGVFTWTPTEAQGPSTNTVTVRVNDSSTGLSDFETITITVRETNTAPVLATIGNKIVRVGSLLTFTASATDADIPRQTLTCSLDAGAPAGASINPSNGVVTWTPTEAQGPGTNRVTVRVTDNGSPPLSAAQTVTITVLAGSATNVTLVATGWVWRYRDTGEDLGSAWTGLDFDDSGWASGRAKFGYGNGDEATVVSYGPDPSAKYITTYFRSHFMVTDPSALSTLSLRVLRDDGVVVYLNGWEVYRDNMPDGPIDYLTRAASTAADGGTTYFVSPPVDAGYFVAGDNVVAAEIHQRSGTSSDIAFDLEFTGAQNIVADTPPAITIGITPAGGVFLWWTASPGRIYRVQYRDDLSTGAWNDLQNDLFATNSVCSATDAMGSIGQRFYRVVRMD